MEGVTLAKDTIHNPAEPRHFMKLKPVDALVRVSHGHVVLAETTSAVRVLEIGKDFYDPVLYLPETDRIGCFSMSAAVTNCPLKGDASYFSLTDANGNVIIRDIGWFYPSPYNFASGLTGLIAFNPAHVTIEESPA